jgi:hypothetical protein
MTIKKIKVSKPFDEFIVDPVDLPGSPFIGRGESIDKALGDFLWNYAKELGIEIEIEQSAKDGERRRVMTLQGSDSFPTEDQYACLRAMDGIEARHMSVQYTYSSIAIRTGLTIAAVDRAIRGVGAGTVHIRRGAETMNVKFSIPMHVQDGEDLIRVRVFPA